MTFETRTVLLLLLPPTLLTIGCLSPAAIEPPQIGVETPDRWSADTLDSPETQKADTPELLDATVLSNWWTTFGQPDLDTQIETVLSNNFSLEAASARVEQAMALARLEGADLKPQLNAEFTGSRRRQNFIGFPIPGSGSGPASSTSTNLGTNLNVSWEIDLWGRMQAARDAGRSRAEASIADLEAIHLSLAGQTAKTWFATREAVEQVRLARSNLESLERTERQIRRRYELGLRSALDLRLATASRTTAEAALAGRLQQLESAERQSAVLAGSYPTARATETGDLPDLPDPVPVGLPSEILTRRPDLRASEQRLAAAGFTVGEARASLYPQLRLTGSLGRASERLEDLLDSDFSVWSLAGNLLQPIFQGGRLRANVELTEAQLREAAASHAQQVLVAFSEVESALGNEHRLHDQEIALAAASRQSEAAQKLAEERYAAGLVEYLSVLETQRQAFNVRSQYLQTRRDRLDNRVDLHLALGGDFSDEEHDPMTPSMDTPEETEAAR